MPTEVQLKDGARLRLKGDNLTPEQVSEKVKAFRAQQMQLAQPEQVDAGFQQRLAPSQQPRPVDNPELTRPVQSGGELPYGEEPDVNTYLARREAELTAQPGTEVTAGPSGPGRPEGLIGPYAEQALSLGLSDELAGLARLLTGGSFKEGAEAERERIKGDALSLSPEQKTAISVGGAIAGGGPTKELLTRTPGLLGSAVLAGKTGALFGGVEGGARAEGGLAERGVAAGRGAIAGGGLGLALGFGTPAVFNAVNKGFRTVGNAVTARTERLTSRERRALKEIMRAFSDDGISPPEARRRLAEWADQGGEPAALFDIGGPAVERLARSLGGKISRSASRLQSEVEQRLANQADEVADNLARTVSRETNYAQAVDDLHTFMQVKASPLYKQAYGQKVSVTPDMQRLLSRDAVKRAIPNARRIASNEDIDLADLGLVQKADGGFAFADEVDVQLVDYLKRGIDRDLNRRFRDTTTGRLNIDDESRGIVATKKALLKQADKQAPVYKEARDVWSGTSDTLEALAVGKDIFKPSLNADILAKRIRGMSEGDKEYLRAGVVRAITDKVENTPDGASVVGKFFNREAFRKKLRLIFDDRAQLESFEALMRRQLEKVKRTQRVSPTFGSQTQPRGGDVAQRAAEGFDIGVPLRSTLRAGGRAIVRSIRDKRAGALQDQQDETVFELLFDKDNPLRVLERGKAVQPELAVQRAGAVTARPGSIAVRRAVDELTANQPQ